MTIIAVVRREPNLYLIYTPGEDNFKLYAFDADVVNEYTRLDASEIMFASYDVASNSSVPLLSFTVNRKEDKSPVELSRLDAGELLDIINGFYEVNEGALRALITKPTLH